MILLTLIEIYVKEIESSFLGEKKERIGEPLQIVVFGRAGT